MSRITRRAAVESLECRRLLAVVPAGFVDTPGWVTGVSSATSMAFAPDGRLFVTQQTGQLRVVRNGALLATPFATIATNVVDDDGERGLLGVAFDPDFANNGYVYVYYTVQAAGGDGQSGANNRISRFTAADADPDPGRYVPGDTAAPGSELVLVNLDTLSGATNHNGGAIHFGPDGKLYAAVGENANRNNSQTLNNRLGKMLRYNADGTIPTDNPFYTQATGANRAIWALGLRNPFTFEFQPGTGRMFINDVGEGSWEEINDGRAGANYGWPATEGDFNQAQFPQYTRPVHAYPRSIGNVISGGTFYNPPVQNFPTSYLGDYFFADLGSSVIRKLDAPITGPGQAATGFATGASGPVDLDVGPDGLLYYLSRGMNRIGRVRYANAVAPTITTHPTEQRVAAGQPATFTVVATGEPPLTYQWQRMAPATQTFVDIPGATSASYRVEEAAPADNGARFRVIVTNPFGSTTSNEASLIVMGPMMVEARRVFYNNSAYDGFDPAVNEADDDAIAPDKAALLPGQAAAFANVTGYTRGINGIMIDVFNMTPDTPIDADNFFFRTGSGDGTWGPAPAPTAIVVRGLPTGAIRSRVTVTWADGAIADEWLQVTFSPLTDLPPGPGGPIVVGDVFYFGNLRGETDGAATDPPPALVVNALDVAATKNRLSISGVGIDDPADHNRDGRVNALDVAAVKQNLTRRVDLFTAPPPPVKPAAAASALPSVWKDTSDDLLA